MWGTGTWTRVDGAWGTWEESDGDTGTRKDTGTDRRTDSPQKPARAPFPSDIYLHRAARGGGSGGCSDRPGVLSLSPPHKVHGHPGVTAVPRASTRCPVQGDGRGGGGLGVSRVPELPSPKATSGGGGDSRGRGTPGSLRSPSMGTQCAPPEPPPPSLRRCLVSPRVVADPSPTMRARGGGGCRRPPHQLRSPQQAVVLGTQLGCSQMRFFLLFSPRFASEECF